MRYKLVNDLTPSASVVEFTPATLTESQARKAKKSAGIAAKPIHAEETPQDDRFAVAEKLVGFILKRIQNPKNGEPFFLSPTDKDDATQAGFFACVESGFFESGNVTRGTFKAIRNAMQARDCLRLRCQREIATPDIETVSDAAGNTTEFRTFSKLTKAQVRISREMFRVLNGAKRDDKTRKSAANYKTNSRFFLYLLTDMTKKTNFKGLRVVCASSLRSRMKRFIAYLEKGHLALSASGKPANLGEEIMQALRAMVEKPAKLTPLQTRLQALA